MKAYFPIVGEKEYKNSNLRTEQRQCVFTKLRVETVFISFVSFSFNSHHVSIDIHHWAIPHCGQTQQFNIQHSKVNIALRASVCKKLFVSFGLFVFIIISCSNSSERPAANKIREIREIRVRIKKQSKIRVHIKYRVRSACKNIRLNSCDSCSKT